MVSRYRSRDAAWLDKVDVYPDIRVPGHFPDEPSAGPKRSEVAVPSGPGIRMATAVVAILWDGRMYGPDCPNRMVPVDAKTYAALRAVEAIDTVPWDLLPREGETAATPALASNAASASPMQAEPLSPSMQWYYQMQAKREAEWEAMKARTAKEARDITPETDEA